MEVTQLKKVGKFPIPVRIDYTDMDQHGVKVRKNLLNMNFLHMRHIESTYIAILSF